MEVLALHSMSGEIDKVFKSLMQSGRPDVVDDNQNVITPEVYVDLFENDYILRQVLDDNHTLLKGRRGTGKSTIFVKAEDILTKESVNSLPIYINLQTCYEVIRTSNSETEDNQLTRLQTYRNFLTEILENIKKNLKKRISNNGEINKLFLEIKEGQYIDKDFERTLDVNKTISKNNNSTVGGSIGTEGVNITANLGNGNDQGEAVTRTLNEIRIFSIHSILKQIKDILHQNKINKVYLFLDDFSELNEESQKAVIDSLIAPIISSYNDTFKVKIAAYPGRITLGNADATKIVPVSLDFYEAYEASGKNYNGVERLSIDYIKRTLEMRLNVFTNGQVKLNELFDTTNYPFDDYLKRLFDCTCAIPRSLGYILNYCYLASINNGDTINMQHIDDAAIKYYDENIYADFANDIRFKQSFYDDKSLLDQVAQKNLADEIIEYLYNLKRKLIDNHMKGTLTNQLFKDTIQKKGSNYWIPTSHFHINKDSEKLLKTLELYYIVNKYSEGSTRGDKVSYYGLNYGLCVENKIDFGRPEGRRKYDYWRQPDFELTKFIPQVLSNIEVIECSYCNKVYSDLQYEIYLENENCFKCTEKGTVVKKNKFQGKLEKKIEEWRQRSLPNTHISILRVLFNKKDQKISAFEIGNLVDKHHLTITNSMRTLCNKGYVDFEIKSKRYYYIKDKSISEFFSDSIDSDL
ncbi:hypothetical protein [Oceanobacillus oncorhynchi]|uniref:hypothetical protein n=1 Tax=Oceanobacillus oncorhynchi TaxID=545501 RepID=UPI0018662669|nr:hypothetical protein [Oceanobacillus oncorhynchi]